MKNNFFLVSALFFIGLGCSTSGKKSDGAIVKPTVTLSNIEALSVGVTTMQDIKKIIGSPEREMRLGNKGAETGWAYNIEGGQQFSLTFNSKTGVLQAMLWVPQSEQPEFNLKEALARYPKAHFEITKRQWAEADAIYEKSIYSDKKLGIEIALWNYSDSKVESISWSLPDSNSLQRFPSQKSN